MNKSDKKTTEPTKIKMASDALDQEGGQAGNIGTLPLLPLRDVVVFPGMVVPIDIGREKSLSAIEKALASGRDILLVAQKAQGTEEIAADDIYNVCCVGSVLQMLRLPGGTSRALIEGKSRAKIHELHIAPTIIEASYSAVETADKTENTSDAAAKKRITRSMALRKATLSQFERYARLSRKRGEDLTQDLEKITSLDVLADQMSARMSVEVARKQSLLETFDPHKRLELIFDMLEQEVSMLQMENRIRSRVKNQMEKTQREYYLNEQMKAIQRELGEGDSPENELEELKARVEAAKLPKEAREKAKAEIKRMSVMSPMSAEATVVRNYLDWLIGVPWKKRSKEFHDLEKAGKTLDTQHYGLDKVKERILEYLAVQARLKDRKEGRNRGSLLCLVGPPGVGKTSLGRSIAEATGRKFVRMSLGGMRDEAEIRGHRRTYIGAMPGKIIQGMKKAGTTNPLFLLDEIDKLGYDWRGDPASALLEVLDPEQNSTFNDHYMEVDYDLSRVMFITTANTMNMPPPLLDRLEIIRLAGYTEQEKAHIAFNHLVPKIQKDSGLDDGEWGMSHNAVLRLIREYTREAGVRNLERELANLMRKAVKSLMVKDNKSKKVRITETNLPKWAGVRKFSYQAQESEDMVGITTGLAWTGVGGELLTIEVVRTPGTGRVSHTGKLGDIMKESIQAAENFIKSRAPQLGITPQRFAQSNVHVHVPEGATPKDGPSAGVAMITSIISALTDNPVRHDVAMTGEITLRGRVLPIGGLKEKLLAAHRGQIKCVIIPEENVHQLEEIPAQIKDKLEIVPVKTVEDVLKRALVNPVVPYPWKEDDERLVSQMGKNLDGDFQGTTPPSA